MAGTCTHDPGTVGADRSVSCSGVRGSFCAQGSAADTGPSGLASGADLAHDW